MNLCGQVSVTTNRNDINRTGANPAETILNTSNVNVNTFGKLFSRAVDGQIYAQPLYLFNVTIPGQGVHNVVYVCTEHNSVYAFDADAAAASTPLWQVNLGPSLPAAVISSGRDLLPEIGITGTPVIDPTTNTLYVVAESYESSAIIFRLHALDTTTGAEKFNGPTVIQGSVPGTSSDGSGGVLTFNGFWHWQRCGLLLANGNVYIGFGGHQDTEPYHGWIFAYSATTLQKIATRCFSPNSNASGVWQGGVAPAADSSGHIYLFSGQGAMDANTGGGDYGDSILKLDSSSAMSVVDYFAPSNAATLDSGDLDLSAGAPILMPGTTLGVGGGKDGRMFLFNTGNLGKFNSTSDQVLQEWRATPNAYFAGQIYYNSTLFAWGRSDVLKAYAFNGSTFNTTPTQGTIQIPAGYSNEPGMSLSSNGVSSGSAIIWAAFSANGDADGNSYPGIFHAIDASNLTRELWNSNQNQSRDYSGSWAKWCPPTIVNGKVYLATFDNILNVYGLLSGSTGTGSLLGSGTSSAAAVNLTAEGTSDWVHWGDANLDRKAGVTAQVSTYTVVGSGTPSPYSNDPRPMSWTDGTPVAGDTNSNGLYINGVGNGFSITAPADTATRTLIVHVGGWNSAGTLTAHLWDGSAADFTDTTTLASGQYDRNYTLTYSAGSAGLLTVTWTMISGSGNVTLNGAALSGPAQTPSSITATLGTPQSATINAAFGTGLQATVKDAGGNAVSGATVTFTAPASGASAKFGASATASVVTNASGVATAPTLTANGTAGSYTVTASVTGVAGVANFNLTNNVGAVSSISATAGTPQGATVNAAFGTALQATVKDAGGNAVSGATVTFTAPASGASAKFGGSATASVVTNASGVASAPTLTANGTAGSYTVMASVTGVAGVANFNLTNNAASGNGLLSGSGNSSATLVNLTSEGTTDWEHWDGGMVRKAGVTAVLSDYTMVGTGTVKGYGNDPRPVSWTDGTPTATSPNNVSGVYIDSQGRGFSITAPADTSSRTLIVHVGGWDSGGTLTAHLSDGSAADFVDVPASSSSQYDRNYTLTYSASAAGQTLAVTWIMTSGGGNVTLNAAALAESVGVASISATAGTPQSATVNAAFGTALQATVKDAGGNAVSGATVTFTAPASGASAKFGASATASVVTNASGVATAPTLTANGTAGSYTVTASVTGVAGVANFDLTNNVGAASSISATAGTPQGATVNAAFGTALQATVKDAGGNAVSGATVTFTAPASGASAKFGASATASVVTNASGVATAPTLTANGTAGSYTVTASVTGVAGVANFNLTNNVGAASSISATAGTPQGATVNAAFGTALQATVKDAGGNAVSGATVTFTAPASGASAKFGASATASVVTNASGVATAPTLTANGTAGSYTVTASVTGVAGVANFNLTNNVGAASSISATAGTPQGATVNAAFGTALQATVKDAGGNAVSGATVTFTAPASGASAKFGASATASVVTNASGVATAPTLTANGTAGSYTVTASVTGVAGVANFNLTNNVGAASSISATAGTPQGATVNAAFGTALQATVKDAGGNAVSGATVTFTAPASGASAKFGTSATASVVTNASGVATAPTLTANGTAGSYTVTASVTGVAGVANFNLTNNVGAASSISATAGTPQSATVNAAFGTALQATVKDAGGNAVSGATVTFTAPASGASAKFGTSATASVVTNASGVATAPTLTANGTAGSYTVTASVAGVATPASFNLTNTSLSGNGYAHSRIITIAHTQVPNTDQTSFPMLFNTTDALLKTVANGGHVTNASGFDIIFTSDAAGTLKLNHEIEAYNGTTGQFVAWVQIPTLSHTADTVIYFFYDNSSITTSQENRSGVWDSNFAAVYHMADNAANTTITDSTGANSGAAQVNTNTKTATGEISAGISFNGSSDYITVTENGHFNFDASPFTLEAWVKDDTAASGFSGAFHRMISWHDPSKRIQMGIGQDTTGTKRLFYLMNSNATAVPNQASAGNAPTGFNHVVATFDGTSTYHIYLNGVNADGGSSRSQTAYTGNSTTLYLGQLGDGLTSKYLNGILDEVRISGTTRSPDWITTEYHNQSSPGTFYTLGSEQ